MLLDGSVVRVPLYVFRIKRASHLDIDWWIGCKPRQLQTCHHHGQLRCPLFSSLRVVFKYRSCLASLIEKHFVSLVGNAFISAAHCCLFLVAVRYWMASRGLGASATIITASIINPCVSPCFRSSHSSSSRPLQVKKLLFKLHLLFLLRNVSFFYVFIDNR